MGRATVCCILVLFCESQQNLPRGSHSAGETNNSTYMTLYKFISFWELACFLSNSEYHSGFFVYFCSVYIHVYTCIMFLNMCAHYIRIMYQTVSNRELFIYM